jgi:hypothetical protein
MMAYAIRRCRRRCHDARDAGQHSHQYYNYGRFLGPAIDSAVSQDYPKEILVGSTDHSCEIIFSYADRIIPIFKENGGPSVGVQRWRSRQPRRYFVLP